VASSLEPYSYGRALDSAMYAVSIISPLGLAPQLYLIFSTHDVIDLSLSMWVFFTAVDLLWLVWGMVHRLNPVIVANMLGVLLNVLGVIGILLFR
jgi:uncharacterized protein with PQ loop repeat